MSPHVERSKRIREARERIVKRDTDRHLEIPTTDPETNSRTAKLGTAWVAPGEGSTWEQLVDAFGVPWPEGHSPNYRPMGVSITEYLAERTNLLLTGSPLTAEDRRRWESGKVR